MIKESIKKIIERENLTTDEAYKSMLFIMNGEATPAQIACYITALRMKGETIEEITGSAMAMREKAIKINVKSGIVIDTCGTGGDGGKTFNISTASAFVAAGAGMTVAKHGNKAVSSQCGSADVLQILGVNIQTDIETIEKCVNEIGIGFLFAPSFHTAMKHAIGPRREIGIRTIFNILGPLTNPASASCQVLGVYDEKLTEKLCNVLKNLGSNHAFIVHGDDGLDEITITADTKVSELKNDTINTYYLNPENFGIKKVDISEIRGGTPEENANIIKRVLNGEKGPHRDIVLLNSACALVAGDLAMNITNGLEKSIESIDSGKAKEKLEKLVKLTNA